MHAINGGYHAVQFATNRDSESECSDSNLSDPSNAITFEPLNRNFGRCLHINMLTRT